MRSRKLKRERVSFLPEKRIEEKKSNLTQMNCIIFSSKRRERERVTFCKYTLTNINNMMDVWLCMCVCTK